MRNVKARVLLLAFGSLMLLNACNAQEDKKAGTTETVIATVNGTPIYQSMMDNVLQQSNMRNAPNTPELRKALMDELIGRELLLQEGLKKGIDKRPEIKQQLDLAQSSIIVNASIQDYLKNNQPTDDKLKAEYDKIKAQIGDKQYNARHILVKTEKEAKDILAQLKKGAKFEKLAEKSLDPGSRVNGGDLGWSVPSAYVQPFAEALVALKKGEVTKAPVQTQFGYHVIKLEDVKNAPPFEEVKANLTQRVQQEQLREHIEAMRAKAKIDIKAAAPAASHPSAPATAPAPAPAPAEKK